MKKKKEILPLSLRIIRGGFPGHFVIKHTRYGIIKTKFPDMSGIVASQSQKKCRKYFKEAVAKAREVMNNTEQRKEWEKKLRSRFIFNKLISFYMKRIKNEKEKSLKEVEELIIKAVKKVPRGKPDKHLLLSPKHLIPFEHDCEKLSTVGMRNKSSPSPLFITTKVQ